MSVKFEKDVIKQTGPAVDAALPALPKGVDSIRATLLDGKHDMVHNVGAALTGGKANEGTKGYLAVRDQSQDRAGAVNR